MFSSTFLLSIVFLFSWQKINWGPFLFMSYVFHRWHLIFTFTLVQIRSHRSHPSLSSLKPDRPRTFKWQSNHKGPFSHLQFYKCRRIGNPFRQQLDNDHCPGDFNFTFHPLGHHTTFLCRWVTTKSQLSLQTCFPKV